MSQIRDHGENSFNLSPPLHPHFYRPCTLGCMGNGIQLPCTDRLYRPAYLYRFSRDIPILALNHDFPISCGGVPILEDAGIFREFLVLADFVLFCFRRYSVILSASCTYRQSGCCVAAINSPLHAMNQCKPSMSPYKKFPGHLRDLESVVNRGSGAQQYLFLNAVPIVCIVQSVSAILR